MAPDICFSVGTEATFPSSLRLMEIHLIGFRTSTFDIFHLIAGFHRIDSNIALAADGVMTS